MFLGPFSGSNASMLLFAAAGLALTIGAVAGIVALARLLRKPRSTGFVVATALGIACLAAFVLVGLFATGCGVLAGAS
jgi:hypothetical protein